MCISRMKKCSSNNQLIFRIDASKPNTVLIHVSSGTRVAHSFFKTIIQTTNNCINITNANILSRFSVNHILQSILTKIKFVLTVLELTFIIVRCQNALKGSASTTPLFVAAIVTRPINCSILGGWAQRFWRTCVGNDGILDSKLGQTKASLVLGKIEAVVEFNIISK